jgi:hypothetical protein
MYRYLLMVTARHAASALRSSAGFNTPESGGVFTKNVTKT